MTATDIDPVPHATVAAAERLARHREALLASGASPLDALARIPAARVRLHTWPAHSRFHRAYDTRWGRDAFNRDRGDTRFAPLVDQGKAVPSMYGAESEAAALLETVSHDLSAGTGRAIYERTLVTTGLVTLETPVALPLIDLRGERLSALGLRRAQPSRGVPSARARGEQPGRRTWPCARGGDRRPARRARRTALGAGTGQGGDEGT